MGGFGWYLVYGSKGRNEDTTPPMFTVIAILLMLVGFMYSIGAVTLPEGETNATWFQRYGSILTIYGIYYELALIRVLDGKNNKNSRIVRYRKFSKFFAHFTLIIGTVIWGYGDLIYIQLTQ